MAPSAPGEPSAENSTGVSSTIRRKTSELLEILKSSSNGVGYFLLSLLAVLFVPYLPLFFEWVHSSKLTDNTITITAYVLSAGFIVSAEHNIYRVVYILLFFASIALALDVGPDSPIGISSYDKIVMSVLAFFHMTERFYWHIYLDRKFPDWLSNGERG